jgi:hypothetical protein
MRPDRARHRSRAAAAPPWLRGAALMPLAAFAVHQLRYKLAYGGGASEALAAQGHAYLSSLVPWIVLLATLSLGATLGGLARRWAAGAAGGSRGGAFVRTWLAVALALLALYAGQELLEGLFASGHLAGLAAVVGDGGWWAGPAALLVGGLLALALRGARAAGEALAAARIALSAAHPAPAVVRVHARLPLRPRLAPLARAGAGRAPPRALLPAV